MDNHNMDSLSMRGIPQERKQIRDMGGGFKSKGRSKSPGKGIRKCWKWGKVGHYKKDCISKNANKEKGSEDNPSTKVKKYIEKEGDVYLYSMGNHSKHDI